MSTKRVEIDWTHPPPGVECSWTPHALHDGLLERLEFDVRARTVSMVVEVDYLRRFAGLPDDVRFGIEISEVTAMRAQESRNHPDPIRNARESRGARETRGSTRGAPSGRTSPSTGARRLAPSRPWAWS
ncbi:MAG: hypothetical protein M3Y87_13925 [Myxococcota bacterium]|nr:hypothetical protein [Myxococcota bacterium]